MNQESLLPEASIDIDIPFHDVDSLNIAWHGHYAKYLELARCKLLDDIGYNYVQMRESGYSWPIVDMRIKYIRPLHFMQQVRVRVRMLEWEYRLKFSYEIFDCNTGEKLSKAQTTQMAVDMASGETCFESPDVVRRCLGFDDDR